MKQFQGIPSHQVNRLKRIIKMNFPFLIPFLRGILDLPLVTKSTQQIFTDIYRNNKWGDQNSRSGTGSNIVETESIRKSLPLLIKEINCGSLLDIPCGDFFWMRLIDIGIKYMGGDIVPELIENNKIQYENDTRQFFVIDITKDDLPKADLILCRDCLPHFSYRDIFRALNRIKNSESTFLLTSTYIDKGKNENIFTGSWRPINLQIPPFNFPPPLTLIDEKCPDYDLRDKSLGLWRIFDIPVSLEL